MQHIRHTFISLVRFCTFICFNNCYKYSRCCYFIFQIAAFKIKFSGGKIVSLKVRGSNLVNPPCKPFDPALRVAACEWAHTHARRVCSADKSLRLKLPVKVANGRRPSPACSPRNAFRNFMLIWLVTLDQRGKLASAAARRRVG